MLDPIEKSGFISKTNVKRFGDQKTKKRNIVLAILKEKN
jgi:hypothetical protein